MNIIFSIKYLFIIQYLSHTFETKITEHPLEKNWLHFKSKFNKKYTSVSEEIKRFLIFIRYLQKILG